MSDRELLERAAKAAGIEFDPARSTPHALFVGLGDRSELWWQPQNHDGQALRLAVKLEFDIHQRRSDPAVWVQAPMMPTITQPIGDDRMAATRRAIVRAAAAMAGYTER